MSGIDRYWLAVVQDYEWTDIHAAFADEADARAYADEVTGVEIREIPVHRPGSRPVATIGWEARAYAHPSNPEPPAVTRFGFSEHTTVPGWVKVDWQVEACEMHAGGVVLRYRGGDRDAVLAACQARYDKAMAALT